ncbi:hypothetical protein Tco_0743722 [Tanacetum coccineum]
MIIAKDFAHVNVFIHWVVIGRFNEDPRNFNNKDIVVDVENSVEVLWKNNQRLIETWSPDCRLHNTGLEVDNVNCNENQFLITPRLWDSGGGDRENQGFFGGKVDKEGTAYMYWYLGFWSPKGRGNIMYWRRQTNDELAPTDGQFFYDDEGIDTAYETEYDVQYSEDAGTDDDDDVDEDFLVDEENEIVKPDVDVHLFGTSMDLPFDNIGITNSVPDDVLEGEDVDVINADGFDSDPGNDKEKKLQEEKKFTTLKEAKDIVYLHSIKSRRNLKLYKNDGVRIRARCDGKVPIFTMSQGTKPTGPSRGMEAGPNAHDKGDLCLWVLINPDIPVKAVQDQLQCELEV